VVVGLGLVVETTCVPQGTALSFGHVVQYVRVGARQPQLQNHDIEEEAHHHGLAEVGCQSIVVDETGDRKGLFASSWNNRIVSQHKLATKKRPVITSRWDMDGFGR
jgi:hypothetical protein